MGEAWWSVRMKSCPTCKAIYPTNFSVCPKDGAPLRLVTELEKGAVLRQKYQILSLLGRGGMGSVYKAKHLVFDEPCVLKLVNPHLLEEPEFLKRFRTEAVAMRRLNHPNAVHVHDFDETEDGRPFIVMEYVDGESLDKILATGPLDWRRAVSIACQVCAALTAAHQLGIVHRDIKPSNILLSRTPQGKDLAKVLDFGLAKIKEDSTLLHGATSLTGTGRVLGTPAYMSPEQARGARGDQLDGRTDLYSLGVVLYEMLTGRPPFTANTPVALMLAHMQSTPSDPGTLRPDLPTPLVKLVLRALEKDPNQRFPSAENMREALERLAEDRTLRLTSLPSTLEEAVSREPLSQGQIPLPATLPSPPRNKLAALLGRAIPSPGQSSSSRWVYPAVVGVVALALVVSAVLFQRRSTPASSVDTPPPTSVTEPAPQEGSVPPGDVTPGTTTPSPVVETTKKQTTRSNTEEIEKLLQQASRAMDRGRYDEAIRAYQAVLDLDVNHAEAQLGLQRARRAQAAEEQILRGPRNQ